VQAVNEAEEAEEAAEVEEAAVTFQLSKTSVEAKAQTAVLSFTRNK